MRTSFCWTVVILVVTALQSKSQEINERVIGDSEQREIIGILCDSYERAYIYPEKVQEIREYLIKQFEAGSYEKYLSASTFAQQLDTDIQYITKDKHTGISYNPEMASEILSGKNDSYYSPELIEELRKSNFGFSEIKILPGLENCKLTLGIGYPMGRNWNKTRYCLPGRRSFRFCSYRSITGITGKNHP